MLTSHGGPLLNDIFGTSFPPSGSRSSTLFADLCGPLQPGSDALVFLASPGRSAAARNLTLAAASCADLSHGLTKLRGQGVRIFYWQRAAEALLYCAPQTYP